jgi:hypothetical protein
MHPRAQRREFPRRRTAPHIDDYRRFLEAEGNCPEYVAQATSRISTIVAGCEFKRISHITSEKVAEHLHALRRDPPRPVLPVGKESFTPAELTEALGGAKVRRVRASERNARARSSRQARARRIAHQPPTPLSLDPIS